MVGKDHVGAGADLQSVRGNREPLLLECLHLFQQNKGINDDSVTDHAHFFPVKDSRRDEMKDKLFSFHHQGMARVVPALKPNDHIGLLRQKIDDFPLPFVSPLDSNHHH